MENETLNNITNPSGHVCGFVAIVGLPNAGKSTLMNRYLKEKISIVTPKPQTTRTNVTSILSHDDYQVIFVDTPGILRPRYRMQEVMASFISSAVDESDMILLIIDASSWRNGLHPTIAKFAEKVKKRKVVVALNKVDLVQKENLLPIIKAVGSHFPDKEIIPVSASEGEGTDELFRIILDHLPQSPKLYPDDIISNEPERFFVAELIRESVFVTLDQELPYATAVIIDEFKDRDDMAVINASIMVEKDSQKPIVIGKKGATIRKIGTQARLAAEEFLGRKVFLDLHVKVRKDWRKKDVFLREAGLLRR